MTRNTREPTPWNTHTHTHRIAAVAPKLTTSHGSEGRRAGCSALTCPTSCCAQLGNGVRGSNVLATKRMPTKRRRRAARGPERGAHCRPFRPLRPSRLSSQGIGATGAGVCGNPDGEGPELPRGPLTHGLLAKLGAGGGTDLRRDPSPERPSREDVPVHPAQRTSWVCGGHRGVARNSPDSLS